MIADDSLFFVFGYPKSGTTFLQSLLDCHPEIMCAREGNFHNFGQQLPRPLNEYNKEMNKKARVFGAPGYPPVNDVEFNSILKTFIIGRLEVLASQQPDATSKFGDKDPDHGKFLGKLAEIFPDATYIHIVRDCRDVAISWYHHVTRLNSGNPAGLDFEEVSVNTCSEWSAYVEGVNKIAENKNLKFIEVYYEDLLKDVRSVSRQVFEFLDASAEAGIVEKCASDTSFEKMAGGRKRGTEDPDSFYRKGVAGDWRSRLDDDLLRRMVEKAEPTLSRLGYS